MIAGGGDSAVDWALSLAEVAAHVAVVHRRGKFRAAPESVARLHAAGGRAARSSWSFPTSCTGWRARRRTPARGDRQRSRRPANAGSRPTCCCRSSVCRSNLGPIADWGLNLHRHHIAVDPATCATGQPGMFAIGDIVTYPGQAEADPDRLRRGGAAAHAIFPLVHPGEALHFEYSTTQGVPGRA